MTDTRPLTAGVMGWPVAQSRSPRLFAHWFARHGLTGGYIPLAVRPEDVAEVYRALGKAGLRGVNVTLPHKRAALELADTASEAARAIGAANTILFGADGGVHATNTDAFGFLESLRAGAPGWHAHDAPAVVLGAGGAARAIVHALKGVGAPEIRLVNRTRETAEDLAAGMSGPVTVADWSARSAALEGAGLLVNTTSLGMTGHAPLEIALDALPAEAVVTDIVYSPLETGLLAAARARGLVAVDGLGMLLHQARPAFEAWFGIDPTVDGDLRAAVLRG